MAYDLVMRNGMVVDGSGSPGFQADVAVEGEKIVAIGKNLAGGRKEIDAKGQVVAPGFIDSHTHAPDAQHRAELVIHLQPVLFDPVLDTRAGPALLLAVGQDLPLEVAVQLASQKRQNVRGREVDRGVVQQPRVEFQSSSQLADTVYLPLPSRGQALSGISCASAAHPGALPQDESCTP
jgi:hypothetical protein